MEIIQYTSKATARVTTFLLGYVPDAVVHISDFGATNPNIHIWNNTNKYSLWTAALSLLLTGSSGIVTRDTTGMTVFAGGAALSTEETADNFIYVNPDSTEVTVVVDDPLQPGVRVPADHQTNSGTNIVWFFRSDR